MAKKVQLETHDNYRIIAISDIHGSTHLLDTLLPKLNLSPKDILIILGDFVNKGGDSYRSLKRISELRKRENTIVLKGNHELFMHRVLASEEAFEGIYDFLLEDHYETLIHSVLKTKGMRLQDFSSSVEAHRFLQKHFGDDLRFLPELPIMAENEDFIFVHGGYDPDFTEDDEAKFLKNDHYNERAKKNDKTVIVGHWPASNLRTDRICNRPYFNHEKKIITIDGGKGVKVSGELNAFIIEKRDGHITYDYVQQNDFEMRTIVKKHGFKKEETFQIGYPDAEIEVVEPGSRMSRCRHVSTGAEFSVFNDLLTDKQELKTTYVNNFLNLEAGADVHLVRSFGSCSLVKHEDEFGWVWTEQIG